VSPATATRRRLIRRFLGEATVTSQQQLVRLLRDEGHTVTQATVSRDLDALGAVKVRDGSGGHYEIADDERLALPAGSPAVVRTLAEWVESISHSGNLVVLRTPPGAAHLVAGAIDGAELTGVLGTLAGDDTVLVVAAAETGGGELAETLERIGAG
jgi:transcriptional regulator of arginine metabolism